MPDKFNFPIRNIRPEMMEPTTVAAGTLVIITSGSIELLSKHTGRAAGEVSCEFQPGDRIVVLDTVNKLCEAEVTEVRGDTDIRVHYLGWPSKWDEWIPVGSPRIHTYVDLLYRLLSYLSVRFQCRVFPTIGEVVCQHYHGQHSVVKLHN
jgi:hypothetical protein